MLFKRVVHPFLMAFFAINGLARANAKADAPGCAGHVELSIESDSRVSLNKAIPVEFYSNSDQNQRPVDLWFRVNPRFNVTPNVVHLDGKRNPTIRISINPPSPGLIRIVGEVGSWPLGCRIALDVPLDVGFTQIAHIATDNRELRVKSTSAWEDNPPLMDGRLVDSFKIQLRDASNQPLEVGAPVTVLLTSPMADLSSDGRDWRSTLTAVISQDHAETGYVFFRLPSTGVSHGTIEVHLKKDSGKQDLLSDQLLFSSQPAWWVYLLVTLAGAFAYSLFEALLASERNARRFIGTLFEGYGFKLLTAIVIGGLAYLLRETNVLGIKIDTSSYRGYAVLGFLFACLGLEGLFKRIQKGLGPNV